MDDDAPIKRVSDFVSWRRDWGRPPRVILYGEWLYRGTVGVVIVALGLVCCYGAIAAPSQEYSSIWSEWFFRISVGLLGVGILVIGYRAFLHQVFRTQLYFMSFEVNEKVQAEFDRAWDNDDYRPDVTGRGENPSIGSTEYDVALIACRSALEQSYEVAPLEEEELAKVQKILSAMAAAPVANPVAHAAYLVSDGRRRATVCIIGYGDYRSSPSGDVIRESVTQIVLFQIGPNLGRFWIRPETVGDKLRELFFSKEIDPSEAPHFSDRFYFQAEAPERIGQRVPSRFYDAIVKGQDIMVIGSESHLIAARDVHLSPSVAKQLVRFAFRIISCFAG